MSETLHTWWNRTIQRYRSAPFLGPAGSALIGYLAGLLPDSLSQAMTDAVMTAVPIRGVTLPSALAYLLRNFGLPQYQGETYAETFDRLESAWTTHGSAGTPERVEREIERLPGFSNIAVLEAADVGGSESADFWISCETPALSVAGQYGDGRVYGGFVYGVDGITPAQNAQLRACVKYWKNARTRYRGPRPE